ncbi:MAG: radical SAM protein [Planctomycetota bacterium]|nr:radical SAM protein [Planctomycetota bacterium]
MKILHIARTLPQEQLGPMYLIRALKDAGHEVRALYVPDPLWLSKFRDYAPDIVTWSVMTGSHTAIQDVNRLLKSKFDFFSIMGGPHITFSPECVLRPEIDAVCLGEGEAAIVDLANALEAGEEWRGIENLAYADDKGEMVKNPLRPLVRDLDTLGQPCRSVIYDAQPVYRDSPRKVIVTQRGCPMNCSFCFHHAWRKKIYNVSNAEYVRKRSVSHVIEEALEIKANYPLSFVHFVDDIFNIDDEWLEEFSRRWPVEVGIPFDAILMANMTKESHIRQMKEAGCIYARVAFEAANDYVRNTVFRKKTERKHLTDSARWIKKYGIRLGSLNILGGPGGSLRDDIDTVKLNIECQVDHPLCSIIQPYPEFEINEITKEMGIAVAEYDEFSPYFNREATIEVKDKRSIENLHKWCPLVVRFPKLVPLGQKTLRYRLTSWPLLIAYMLFSEWLVTEQNTLYNRAQGNRSLKHWPPIDFTARVITKGIIRFAGNLGGKYVTRQAMRLQMGDERVAAHME